MHHGFTVDIRQAVGLNGFGLIDENNFIGFG